MKHHIFTSPSAYWVFKMLLKKEKLHEKALYFHDDLSFGPIAGFLKNKYKKHRNAWKLKNVHKNFEKAHCISKTSPLAMELPDNWEYKRYKKFERKVKKIKKKDEIYMYLDEQAGDYLFLWYFLSFCRREDVKVFFNATENRLGAHNQAQMKNFLGKGKVLKIEEQEKFKKIFREIPKKSLLRILEDGEVKTREINTFDDEIIENFITKKWQKLFRIAGNFLLKNYEKGIDREEFFYHRIFALEKTGKIQTKIEYEMLPRMWKGFPARKKGFICVRK